MSKSGDSTDKKSEDIPLSESENYVKRVGKGLPVFGLFKPSLRLEGVRFRVDIFVMEHGPFVTQM